MVVPMQRLWGPLSEKSPNLKAEFIMKYNTLLDQVYAILVPTELGNLHRSLWVVMYVIQFF